MKKIKTTELYTGNQLGVEYHDKQPLLLADVKSNKEYYTAQSKRDGRVLSYQAIFLSKLLEEVRDED